MEAGTTNAVGRMLGLLGDEWTLLVIQQTMLGASRFGELSERLPISDAVLAGRLRKLTDAGLLNREIYQTNPPRSRYAPTDRGRSLWPMLLSIWDWERRWVPEHADPLPAMRHLMCDAEFVPQLTCRACGETASEKDLDARWGPSGSWPRSMPVESTRRRSASASEGGTSLFPQTMSILGNRWAFALLVAAFVGTTRFSDFQSQLGVPPSSLSDRLQILVTNDVLVSADGRYLLTEKGRDVLPILITALKWAQRWFQAPDGPAVELRHTLCGNDFDAVLTCDQCAGQLRGTDIAGGREHDDTRG